MDGKKRIARLRNAEKWKKLGLGAFFGRYKAAKAKAAKTKNVEVFKQGLFGNPVPPAGMEWDHWMCRGVPKAPNGLFGRARNVIEKLEKKGFKVLGCGHYSTVLAKPGSDKVIKVTRHQDNWIDYVKWASEKGYAGGFAPRVYSWKKFPGGWSWAVMERMERCVGDGYDDYPYDYENNKVKPEGGDDFTVIFDLLGHAHRGNVMATVYVEDLCPGALAYVKELRSVMRASDIRAANTMVRKDGSLCFTDPCAGDTKITSTRLRKGDFSPSVWRYF